MKPVNARLIAWDGGSDTSVVHLTFEIYKEDLVGLEYQRPEFVLEITPVEKLFEK